MLVKWAGRLRVIWFYMTAAVVMILCYVLLFGYPRDSGEVGLFVFPMLGNIIKVYMLAGLALLLSVLVYCSGNHQVKRKLLIVVGTVLLLLPLSAIGTAVGYLFRRYEASLVTPDHVYHVVQDIFPLCPDTFDMATYTCYYDTYVYQCDRSGLMCSNKSQNLLIDNHNPLRLQFEGGTLQVMGDDNRIVYTLPRL